MRSTEDADLIRRAFEEQVEDEADFEALLEAQGEQPTRRFFELFEIILQTAEVGDRDRLAWERLWDENRVEVLPAFPFLFDGGFEGQLEGPRARDVMDGYREVLRELVRYCGSEGEPGWAARFALALDDLDVDDPEVVHPVFRLARRLGDPDLFRLFRSCSRAWVFGGPDSWNDVALAGSPDYEELTGRLLHHIKGGILATANQELEAAGTT
ncbi:MAG: hypothetical protein R3F30_06730 [Planctomycetota bacterium]